MKTKKHKLKQGNTPKHWVGEVLYLTQRKELQTPTQTRFEA